MTRISSDHLAHVQADPTFPRRREWLETPVGQLEAKLACAILAGRGKPNWRELADWYLNNRGNPHVEPAPFFTPSLKGFAAEVVEHLHADYVFAFRRSTPDLGLISKSFFLVSSPGWRIVENVSTEDLPHTLELERSPRLALGARSFLSSFLTPNARRNARSSNALALVADSLLDRLNAATKEIDFRVVLSAIESLTYDSKAVTNVLLRVLSATIPGGRVTRLRSAALKAAESIGLHSPQVRRALDTIAIHGVKAEQNHAARIIDRASYWTPLPECLGRTVERLFQEGDPQLCIASAAFVDACLEEGAGSDALNQLRLSPFIQGELDKAGVAANHYQRDLAIARLNLEGTELPVIQERPCAFKFSDAWNVKVALNSDDAQDVIQSVRRGYFELRQPVQLHVSWALPPVTDSSRKVGISRFASFPPLAELTISGPVPAQYGKTIAAAINGTGLRAFNFDASDPEVPEAFFSRSAETIATIVGAAVKNPLRTLRLDGNSFGAQNALVSSGEDHEGGSENRVTTVTEAQATFDSARIFDALDRSIAPERLELLALNNCGIHHGSRNRLSAFLKRCTALATLELEENLYLFYPGSGDEDREVLMEEICNRKLKRLNLGGDTLTGAGPLLGTVAEKCTTLERLDLSGFDLTDWFGPKDQPVNISNFALNLTRVRNLLTIKNSVFLQTLVGAASSLDLSGTFMPDLECIERCAAPLPHVTRRELGMGTTTTFQSIRVVDVIVGLKVSSTLSRLKLYGHVLQSNDVEHLIRRFPELTDLSLINCPVRDGDILVLIEGLSKDLVRLDLSSTRVTKGDVETLAGVPRPLLGHIGLAGITSLNRKDIDCLIRSRHLPVLRTISFGDTTIDVIQERMMLGLI